MDTPTTDANVDVADPPATNLVHVSYMDSEVQDVVVSNDGTTTVGDVLQQADIPAGNVKLVTMNGRTVSVKDTAEPGAVIVAVRGRVANG